MRTVCLVLLKAFGSGLRSHAALQIENAALRHELALAETGSRATSVAASRPAVLDLALSPVARMAASVRDHQARNSLGGLSQETCLLDVNGHDADNNFQDLHRIEII